VSSDRLGPAWLSSALGIGLVSLPPVLFLFSAAAPFLLSRVDSNFPLLRYVYLKVTLFENRFLGTFRDSHV
jgi:hypothetical protein